MHLLERANGVANKIGCVVTSERVADLVRERLLAHILRVHRDRLPRRFGVGRRIDLRRRCSLCVRVDIQFTATSVRMVKAVRRTLTTSTARSNEYGTSRQR